MIFLPWRYLYLSILRDDNDDIFAASLLILYCGFSSLILSSIITISFYILSKRFSLKLNRYCGARIVTITKKVLSPCKFFVKTHNVFKVSIWWMRKCSLLKLVFVSNFQKKIVCRIESILWCSKIRLCNKKGVNVYFSTSDKQNSY